MTENIQENQLFVVTNRITVKADIAAAFEETFAKSMRDTLKGVPGLQRATLMRPEADGLPYVSTMDFDSKADFMAWLKSDSFKASHSNASAPGMQSPNSVEQHSVIELVNPQADS